MHPFKYPSTTYRNYSIGARPTHLEVIHQRGRQFPKKRCETNSDLPGRDDVEYALRFGFQASNNEAEYETVIAGLNLAHSMEADQLEICSDSQLVVKQIEDSYEARGEKIIIYLRKVQELLKKFTRFQFKHVPRVENTRSNALANLTTKP